MCHVPYIEQAYVVSMPIHNPDRQGLIITGSDINITGKFYFDLLLDFSETDLNQPGLCRTTRPGPRTPDPESGSSDTCSTMRK